MPRNFKSTEIYVRPDPRFGSKLATKMINKLMWSGKKCLAQRIFYEALDIVKSKLNEDVDQVEIFTQAVENVKPRIEVRSKRVGGANYQIPYPVKGEKKFALASRWILTAARAKKGKSMSERLAEELIFASQNEGTAIKKKEDVQRMAEANRAFAHFARF